MNGRLVLPVAVVTMLGLVACSNSTTGTGTAAPPPPTTAATTTTEASLTSVQPCDLLDSNTISQHKLTDQEQSDEGGSRNCTWSNIVDDDGEGYALEVSVRDSQGLADINGQGLTVTDHPVGSHRGRQVEDPEDQACFVAVGVGSTARVDVIGSTGSGNMSRSCAVADQYAQLIEPKLP